MQEIQCGALGADQRTRHAFDMAERGASRDAIAIRDEPLDPRRRIELTEALIEPRATAEDCGVAGDDACARIRCGRQQVGGYVSAADVFLKCATDVAFDRIARR